MLERIEVAGCIASGKTTLVKALEAHFSVNYEDHKINPFWKAFYTDPSACTFETEVTFLLQHYHFAKLMGARTSEPIVLDHSFELDVAYAEVGLVGRRKEIFRSIYEEIQRELGFVRVLVFVRCGVDEAAKRIRERARPIEKDLSLEFLAKLNRQLEHRIEEMSERVPVLRVNSDLIDFRQKGNWVAEIVASLQDFLSSR